MLDYKLFFLHGQARTQCILMTKEFGRHQPLKLLRHEYKSDKTITLANKIEVVVVPQEGYYLYFVGINRKIVPISKSKWLEYTHNTFIILLVPMPLQILAFQIVRKKLWCANRFA